MKKLLSLFMIFCMLFSFTSCSEFNTERKYKKALKYYDSKDYSAARELFMELGEYENSQDFLKKTKWYLLFEYLKNKNGAESKNSGNDYKVTMKSAENKIIASYVFDSANISLMISLELLPGESMGTLTGKSSLVFNGAEMMDDCKTILNARTYKKGDSVPWMDYDCYGVRIDGTKINSSTDGLCKNNEVHLERLTEGIVKIISESGLDIEMKDLGFESY